MLLLSMQELTMHFSVMQRSQRNNHCGQPANSGNCIIAFKGSDQGCSSTTRLENRSPTRHQTGTEQTQTQPATMLSKLPSILAQILVEAPMRIRQSARLSVTFDGGNTSPCLLVHSTGTSTRFLAPRTGQSNTAFWRRQTDIQNIPNARRLHKLPLTHICDRLSPKFTMHFSMKSKS
jgi:hypothetical protein